MKIQHPTGPSPKTREFIVLTGLKRLANGEKPIARWRNDTNAKRSLLEAARSLFTKMSAKKLDFDVRAVQEIVRRYQGAAIHDAIHDLLVGQGYENVHIRQIPVEDVRRYSKELLDILWTSLPMTHEQDVFIVVSAKDRGGRYFIFG